MERQAHTGGTVLINSREMTGRSLQLWVWGGGVKPTENINIGFVGWDQRETERPKRRRDAKYTYQNDQYGHVCVRDVSRGKGVLE
jgi:hypothetical protein